MRFNPPPNWPAPPPGWSPPAGWLPDPAWPPPPPGWVLWLDDQSTSYGIVPPSSTPTVPPPPPLDNWGSAPTQSWNRPPLASTAVPAVAAPAPYATPLPPVRRRHRVRNTLLGLGAAFVVLIVVLAALGVGNDTDDDKVAAGGPAAGKVVSALPTAAATVTSAAPTSHASPKPKPTPTRAVAPAPAPRSTTQAPTSAAPTTSAPNSAAAPTSAATAVAAPDKTFRGHGADVVRFAKPLTTVALLSITMTGSENNVVYGLDADGKKSDLLVNTIGRYAGSLVVNDEDDDVLTGFSVEGSGTWTLHLKPAAAIPTWSGASPYHGTGDTVLRVQGVFGSATSLSFTSHDDDNTVVYSYSDEGKDLVVNEIGNVTGTYVVPDSTYVLVVEVGTTGTFTLGVK